MGLRGPGKNSGLNRENPDILIVMIAEKQIMRGGEEDKRDQNERERDGPSKACRGNKWHSATAPCSNAKIDLYWSSVHLIRRSGLILYSSPLLFGQLNVIECQKLLFMLNAN
ncbi:hypothetical protein GBA52_001628 [Prunus armeniaca]|nr:hypothetical protein GBA52_001628 [Prunus armeniaca]